MAAPSDFLGVDWAGLNDALAACLEHFRQREAVTAEYQAECNTMHRQMRQLSEWVVY